MDMKNILVSLKTDKKGPENKAHKVTARNMRAERNHANTKIYCLIL